MKIDFKKIGFRGYISSSHINGNCIPQHVQNIVIRDYAEKNNLLYKLSASEYIIENCTMILENLTYELNKIEGIIFYSIFQLPNDNLYRKTFYKSIIDNNASLHCAVEGMCLNKNIDIIKWEEILKLNRIIPNEIEEIKNGIY